MCEVPEVAAELVLRVRDAQDAGRAVVCVRQEADEQRVHGRVDARAPQGEERSEAWNVKRRGGR